MRIEISHLAGSHRGRVDVVSAETVCVGTDAEADICVGQAAGVLPRHAAIVREGDRAVLRPTGAVRVGGRPVGEIQLRDGDVLEIGEETRLRVHLVFEAEDRSRSFHAALASAPGTARGLPLAAGGRFQGRAGLTVTMLLLLPLIAGAVLATRPPARSLEQSLAREREHSRARFVAQQRKYEQRIDRLNGEMHELKTRMADRTEVEKRMGEVQRAVAQVETSVLDRVDSEVKRSIGAHPELRAARDAVKRMERGERTAEQIIATHTGSVCLIQGAYGFGKEIDGKWKFLREASPELLGGMDVSGDQVPLMLDGDGPIFSVDYTGTGFLVDRRGIVMTNRHIAEPWWRNEAAQPLLKDGYKPRFVHLRAFFPNRKKPVVFRLTRTLVSADADLAALFFRPYKGMPTALPLANPRHVAAGRRVLLLGYPSGLDALIARSGDDFKKSLETADGLAPTAVLDGLAARGLVRPLPTLGHIGDVLGDKIVYDAATAVGGSGGPLVDMEGRVVAVNYGILKAFRGANFGVPVSYAAKLLDRARGK